VLDVPAKLSARARVFSTGQGRKIDVADAHSVAVVALRPPGLQRVGADDHLVALRLLVDRRDELGLARHPHRQPVAPAAAGADSGGAEQFLSATQARALLATIRPRDVVGRTRRQLAAELAADPATIDRKTKSADIAFKQLLEASGPWLLGLYGVGPSGAAWIPGDVGDVSRFACWFPCRCDRRRHGHRVAELPFGPRQDGAASSTVFTARTSSAARWAVRSPSSRPSTTPTALHRSPSSDPRRVTTICRFPSTTTWWC
jgi:hypothetical protein